jgi:multidrug efflux pump subunit AcrA (membrane-fusion protein)
VTAPAIPLTPTAAVLEFLPTDVVTVAPGEIRQLLNLTGALRAYNQAPVKARVAGDVRDVLVREGESVSAGQVLIRMETSDYEARVTQAEGALAAAQGQLEIARQTEIIIRLCWQKISFQKCLRQCDESVRDCCRQC